MLKLSHANLIFISGAIWMAIGAFLLQLGLSLLVEPPPGNYPLLAFFAQFTRGSGEAAMAIVAIALSLGFLKGKFVLRKSAVKGVQRICSFPNPTALSSIYSGKYYILLFAMMLLGMSIKYSGMSPDIRGAIDVIVGSALISGAVCYFRMGWQLRCAS